jgi:hypothetical protein
MLRDLALNGFFETPEKEAFIQNPAILNEEEVRL